MEKDKALFTTNTNGNGITQRSVIEDFAMTSHDFHSFNSHQSGFVFAHFQNPPRPEGCKKTWAKSDHLKSFYQKEVFTFWKNMRALESATILWELVLQKYHDRGP